MSDVWKSIIDADLKDAEYTPPSPIPDGSYPAIVSNVAAKRFETGSKGFEITYSLTSKEENLKGRDIKDYFVVVKADGTINKSGPALTKKLMLECGLTVEQVTKFKFPEFGDKGFGDFKKLLDAPLTIEIASRENKKGKNAGKTFARVMSFKLRAE